MNIPESSAQKYKKKKETGEVVFNFDKQTVPIKSKEVIGNAGKPKEREAENSSPTLKMAGLLILVCIGATFLWKKNQFRLNDFITHSDTACREPDAQPVPYMISRHLLVTPTPTEHPRVEMEGEKEAPGGSGVLPTQGADPRKMHPAPLWLQRPRSL